MTWRLVALGHVVDGRKKSGEANQLRLVVDLPLFTEFYTYRWCRISSINNITIKNEWLVVQTFPFLKWPPFRRGKMLRFFGVGHL